MTSGYPGTGCPRSVGAQFPKQNQGNKMLLGHLGNRFPRDQMGPRFPSNFFGHRMAARATGPNEFSLLIPGTDFLSITLCTDFPSIRQETVFLSITRGTIFLSIFWGSENPSHQFRKHTLGARDGRQIRKRIANVSRTGGGVRSDSEFRPPLPVSSRRLRAWRDTVLALSRSGQTNPAISLNTQRNRLIADIHRGTDKSIHPRIDL